MSETDKPSIVFLSRGLVKKLTGLSGSTLWRLEQKKEFPGSYQLSKNRVAYKSSEVTEWLESRMLTTNNKEEGK